MYEYIKGDLVDLTPTYAVLDNRGIAYILNISLNTYSRLSGVAVAQLFIHQVVREDAQLLYGFFDKQEREIFRSLISVSGVGASTARVMLSSLASAEIQNAIVSGDVNTLKGVKGIGAKTAQRIIIELKDKLGKDVDMTEILIPQSNTIKEEALSALVMLGFTKNSVNKVVDKILAKESSPTVEALIKMALKQL
ncbi:MAG: Holliday junction branch migration protein RuvA [Marinifilaceae bacterium]